MAHDDYSDLLDDEDTRAALEVLDGLDGPGSAEEMIDAAAALGRLNERTSNRGEGPFGDDFSRMRARLGEAAQVFPGDTLAQQAYVERKEEEEAREKAARAPQIGVMPPTWSRAIVGGTQSVSPGQLPVEVATWVGDPNESRPVSVAFGPADPPDAEGSGSDALRPFLRLQFGVERGLLQVDVDVGAGGQLVVPGHVVHALVGLDSGGSVAYTLTVVMGYFAVIRTGNLTRSVYFASLTGTSNQLRPRFATGVLLDRADVTGIFTLDFKDYAGNVIYSRTLGSSQYFTEPVPLYNDVFSVDVVNNGSATNARLAWVLGGL